MLQKFNVLLLAAILISCGKALPALDGIDTEKWKGDRDACQGYRQSVASSIEAEMVKLKGLSEMDIIQLLGKPDQNELYKRNQKFYSFFITPGPNCPAADSTAKKLILRFNAMGYAQLVSVE